MLLNGGVGNDLRIPWTAKRSNQYFLEEISPEYSLEGLMLKLKLQYWCEELTHWKRPWCWERLKAGGEGDDRGWDVWMASLTLWTWVWASSRSLDRKESLACCSPWGHKQLDTTEWLNWTDWRRIQHNKTCEILLKPNLENFIALIYMLGKTRHMVEKTI